MKRTTRHTTLIFLAALLAACGNEPAPEPALPAGTDPDGLFSSPVTEPAEVVTDAGTGVIRDIDAEGGQVMLKHGPLDKIGMGAMTMYFGVTDDVDLGGFTEGATVSFEVRRGRDGSYRITRMCEGEDGCGDPE